MLVCIPRPTETRMLPQKRCHLSAVTELSTLPIIPRFDNSLPFSVPKTIQAAD